MTDYVDAETLKLWLSDGREIALIDVREHGQYGEHHLFFAVPLAYSKFELGLTSLAPNPGVRLVLYDDGDGVAERAAGRAEALGYEHTHVLRGGAAAWKEAGFTLYAGVNVPSKTFGELVELERQTPHVTANQLKAMSDAGDNMVIVDGRPFAEFQKTSIPGGICCPNGELALHIAELAPDPQTKIVVNCAGRTRSIIGAQTLIDLGVPNPVYALENGTQGWRLAGLQIETGAACRYRDAATPADITALRNRARRLAELRGARFVETAEVSSWLTDKQRTTYLIDVRTEEEHAADGALGVTHAPGGQLIQAIDQWIGVRGARLVLVDSELVRAQMVAAWLRQLGHEAYIFAGGSAACGALDLSERMPTAGFPPLATIDVTELHRLAADGTVQIVDLRPSMAYRAAHIANAKWSMRPRIVSALVGAASTVALVAEEAGIAALAAIDLAEAGLTDVRLLDGGMAAWRAAALPVAASPDAPADAECIDFLFFTHRRLLGDAEASRQYLDWEVRLIGQLDEQERASFYIVPANIVPAREP